MSNFRELKVWQKGRVLAREIYIQTGTFPREELFGLTRQMRRAAISIISNIAEGNGRYTRPEQRKFLLIARGSAFELEAQLIMASDLEWLEPETGAKLVNQTTEISKMINGLLRHFAQT
jgi:four helix bundle protein